MQSQRLYDISYRMYLDGLKAEDLVMSLVSSQMNGICFRASLHEDRHDHIDFHCILPNGEHLDVDVKGMRKNSRSDDKLDDTISWVEFKNVNGNNGWLYGKATHIAFVTNSNVIFVKRDELAKFAESKIKGMPISNTLPSGCYMPYQRKGRQDIIAKVLTSDLISISDFILKNNTTT